MEVAGQDSFGGRRVALVRTPHAEFYTMQSPRAEPFRRSYRLRSCGSQEAHRRRRSAYLAEELEEADEAAGAEEDERVAGDASISTG